MIGKCLLLVALTMFAAVAARSTRDAPQPVELPNSFTEFFETAGKSWKELEKTVLTAFGVDNPQQLEKKALDQGKEYATKLDDWALDVKKETEKLKDSEVVKDLRNTVDKVIENWKVNNPQTAEDIKKYMEKTNEGTEQIINKIKDLGESDEAKNIKDLSAKLLENATATFKDLAKQIQENVIAKKE